MDRGYPIAPNKLGGQSGPDTTYNFDTNASPPDPVTPRWSSLYAAEQYGSCPQATMALNYNWDSMATLVTNMSPAGNTNQAIGLQLGWMSLVGGGGMFAVPPMNPNYNYTQAIILLTDGLNTQDRWYTSQSSIDTREQLTCNNINAAGITLYTIQVNTGNDPTSSLLQELRGQSGQVSGLQQILPAYVGRPDAERVHPDRHRTDPVAHRAIAGRGKSKSPANRAGL